MSVSVCSLAEGVDAVEDSDTKTEEEVHGMFSRVSEIAKVAGLRVSIWVMVILSCGIVI